MAKSRRKATARRSSRPKADWVYRANVRAAAPLVGADALGTYEPAVRNINSGHQEGNAIVLYDSHNYVAGAVRTPSALGVLPNAGRAEGSKATALRVEGQMYLEPSTWAVGNIMAAGMRIFVAEQDIASGLCLLDPDYSMWENTVTTQPADFANNYRMNMREVRFFQGFDTNDVLWSIRFGWRGRMRLQANEALWLWLELEGTSVNGRYQSWFRTLIQDEG